MRAGTSHPRCLSNPSAGAIGEPRGAAGLHDLLDRMLTILGIDIVDDDFRAFGGEALRNAATKAGACAGDDRYLVLQSHLE